MNEMATRWVVDCALGLLGALSVLTWTLVLCKCAGNRAASSRRRAMVEQWHEFHPDINGIERQIGRQVRAERERLERGLVILASIANVAPFVGLFGTVFGIIGALHSMTSTSQQNIGSVAGPVGDALIATGIGIAVAIPAVVGYNLLLRYAQSTLRSLEESASESLSSPDAGEPTAEIGVVRAIRFQGARG